MFMRGNTIKTKKVRAEELFAEDCTSKQIALRLGISITCAGRWHREWKAKLKETA